MKLFELLEGIEYEGNADVLVSNIVCDSRKVSENTVFVCIEGYETDGHKYAKECAEKGASAIVALHEVEADCPVVIVKDTRKVLAVLCSRFHNDPSKEFNLVGITGTNGKTTTTYLIKTILENAGHKVGLIGTNQNMIGNKILPAERTTPDGFELQKLFREMADAGCDTVVMEVSSHALDLDRVYACDFDIGLFTNITQDHLDFHKTMENYLDAKTILFKMCKKGIVNCDDERSGYILENATCPVTGFSIDKNSDVKAENVILTSKGVQFDALGEKFSLAIPGKFSVYNGLGAILVCDALGVEKSKISEGIEKAKGVQGRAQVVDLGYDFTVMIDYAHTPDGIENILNTVRGFAKGRVVILFGCGGDRDNRKRPIMGEIASKLADFCIVTSDNPRTENPTAIIEEILTGFDKNCPHVVIENRYEAIKYAIENAEKDDVIVLAGKGHETYQIIGKEKFHFDEEEILQEIKKKYRGN